MSIDATILGNPGDTIEAQGMTLRIQAISVQSDNRQDPITGYRFDERVFQIELREVKHDS